MSVSEDVSIVEYYADNESYRCGYCKSPNTNYSHGMWAYGLTVQDYQDLIDRGWRRSGSYCYKPTMHLTCCPMYTIKCSVLDFKLSKSQKKKLKRFHNFLAHGRSKSAVADDETNESTTDMETGDDLGNDCGFSEHPGLKDKAKRAHSNRANALVNSGLGSIKDRLQSEEEKDEKNADMKTAPSASNICDIGKDIEEKDRAESPRVLVKKFARPGDGMDPNRPQCKKAKLLRLEKREKKLALLLGSAGVSSQKTKTPPAAKSVEDFINEPLPDSPAHRLEIRLVRSHPVSKEFMSTFKAAHKVYQRYQTTIHNDPIEKVTEKQFTRFLVSSPLKPYKPRDGPPQGYGSFHQQYWLDGQLIAVGVIDILPYCVSSVYFFYDPEFHFLGLGTYGSLREIAFCRSLHHLAPSLRFYYMGFYINTCPKMRYKKSFYPSFLLCPEVYSWHPIEHCIPLLENNKYSRFNEDTQANDPDRVNIVNDVLVLFNNEAMHYKTYLSLKQPFTHHDEVTQYAGLIGNKLSKRILLVLT